MSEIDLVVVIERGRLARQYWADLWRCRELFFFLAWRDIIVRYKQTVIGVAWSLLRPLLTMIAFVIVFSKVAKLSTTSVPYPILVFTAVLPWQLFSSSLSDISNSLVNNSNLITKVYFPRLIVPLSSAVVSVVDFVLSMVIFVLLMMFYSYFPSQRVLFLPLFIAMVLLTSIGAGLWLSALSVKYRDFRYVVPFIVQFGLYVSPVGFSSDRIPVEWRLLYSINPMVGVIDGFRWCLLFDTTELYLPGLVSSLVFIVITLISGIHYFRNTERTFADKI